MCNYTKAIECNEKSLKIRLKLLGGEENFEIATSYNSMGTIFNSMSNYPKAIEYYEKSSKILIKLLSGEENVIIATIYNNIGSVN
jgi:tetratricopeptide (TPR) repeat protein